MASSIGSPTTSVDTSATRASVTCSAISRCTSTRWVEMQLCPAWANPATRIFDTAVFQSLSPSMMTGALLPSSRPTRLRGARARMPQPTSGDPVNVTRAMPGWSTMALPTVPPLPVTTCSHSGGRPHSSISSSARAIADNGVWLAGLSTTGQPAAMAGASLWATRLSGKLNGEIAPTTPIGTRMAKPILPSPAAMASSGTISPSNVRASAEANRNVPTARCASARAVRIGLAASAATIRGEALLLLGERHRGAVEHVGALPARQRRLAQGRGGDRARRGRRRRRCTSGRRPRSIRRTVTARRSARSHRRR